MFKSQGFFKLSLAVAAAALLTLAGCSNKATDQATNQAPPPPKKTDSGKPGAGKAAVAKPPAKKAEAGKVVAAKGATAKPVAVSSKVAQPTNLVTVPKGTAISATIGQTLASNKSHSGDSFVASLSSPIKVGGKTVIPKGAHVTGRVVTAKKSSAELTVALASVDVNGKSYKLVTDPINRSGKTQAKSDTGDADAAKAKGKKDITLPAESRLKFKLAKDVKIPVPVKS
jgi:hypothetical protein